MRACVVTAPRLWLTHVRVARVAALRKCRGASSLSHDAPPRALPARSGKSTLRSRCYADTAVGGSEGVRGEGVLGEEVMVLGIESSCDDTGVAVVDQSGRVWGEALHSQIEVHQA